MTGAYSIANDTVHVQVGLWVFGENFPAASDPPAEQVFSLLTAGLGLAAFALILALVEQVPSVSLRTSVPPPPGLG